MVLPPRTGMPLHFGISITSADKNKIVGEMQADERHLNAFGIPHGGALMAFGDELRGLGSRFHIPLNSTKSLRVSVAIYKFCCILVAWFLSSGICGSAG
jgi:acyl-coenzyme A thioesterase PaaI-like protein